jgi:pimeloyl-ACP methyl ester carboxylesterase
MTTIELRHARVHLALHRLQEGSGTPLLLLHALRGSAADWQHRRTGWPGAVYALDLSGHGRSGHVRGGGYTPELWVGDADIALAYLKSEMVVAGAGTSAYVALLLAGARPAAVRCSVLLPGDGLDGGGAEPDLSSLPEPLRGSYETGALRETPLLDPAVNYAELEVRPVWYAKPFAEVARRVVLVEDGRPRPPWWTALRCVPNVFTHTHDDPDLVGALAAAV